MLKIKFKEYSVTYKNQYFKVLIPAKPIEQLWVTPEYRDNMTFWDGNRFAFQTLYEAAKIMTYMDHIMIYFPLNESKYRDYIYDGQHYDMVWMNHQYAIRNSDLKQIINKVKKSKKISYFHPKKENSVIKNCEKFIRQNGKEFRYNQCPFEVKFNSMMVYRLPHFFYDNMIKNLDEFLHQHLEKENWNDEMGDFYPYTWLDGHFYCKQKSYYFSVELGFGDIQLEKRKNQNKKRKEKL